MDAETRSLNKCVYVQHSNDPNDAQVANHVPRNPIAKLGILASVLPEQRIRELVLHKLETRQTNLHYPTLVQAVRHIWEGNSVAAAGIVGDLDIGQVIQFAEESLQVEETLLQETSEEVTKAIANVTQTQNTAKDTLDTLRYELRSMRDSIVNEVTNRLRRDPQLRSLHDLRVPTTTRNNPESTTSQPATSQPDINPSVLKSVNLQNIYQEIAVKSPEVTTYLERTGFFPLFVKMNATALTATTHLLVYAELARANIDKKRQQLSSIQSLTKVDPVGYLHLERLNFTPVGYERGELVYSLPMVPSETVRLTHREWSRTENEYTKLVATSLETAAEDALSEKSELAQSYNTQEQHSSAFNASASVSGGFGGVQFSSSVGYNAQHSNATSREYSSRHSQEVTHKSSSRSKEEHKITFRVATIYETEEQSYREVTNPFDHPVRYDFHRMMKKWRIDLYRYDVRMTYDIVIPEPASYLLRKHIALKALNDELAKPNPFDLSPSMISASTYESQMQKYQVALEPPPKDPLPLSALTTHTYSGQRIVGYGAVELILPDGYEFTALDKWTAEPLNIVASDGSGEKGVVYTYYDRNINRLQSGAMYSNRFLWQYAYDWSEEHEPETGDTIGISVVFYGKLTDRAFQEWQIKCYQRLVDAAEAQYELKRQRTTQLRDLLQAELDREDALTLRKLEKEEIMKGVLQWVLGPRFRFYPKDLPALGLTEHDLEYYVTDTNTLNMIDQANRVAETLLKKFGIEVDLPEISKLVNPYSVASEQTHEAMLRYGAMIRFLHHAIEWENVIYVLYPYFWTHDNRWDFKQSLYHTEYVHRSFLRAGAARVVLTIRPGYEEAFLSFVETLDVEQSTINSPYMRIAQELKNMAQTSYPYTPGANVETGELVDTWYEFTPTGALDVTLGSIISDQGTPNNGV